jgi:hypothetical protein
MVAPHIVGELGGALPFIPMINEIVIDHDQADQPGIEVAWLDFRIIVPLPN